MEHTLGCEKINKQIEQEQKKFAELHPNYCRTCGGWGGFQGSQSVPYGMGDVSMPTYDTCQDCSDILKCPHCAAPLDEEDPDNCPACFWNAEKSDGMPENHECICYHIPDELRLQDNMLFMLEEATGKIGEFRKALLDLYVRHNIVTAHMISKDMLSFECIIDDFIADSKKKHFEMISNHQRNIYHQHLI